MQKVPKVDPHWVAADMNTLGPASAHILGASEGGGRWLKLENYARVARVSACQSYKLRMSCRFQGFINSSALCSWGLESGQCPQNSWLNSELESKVVKTWIWNLHENGTPVMWLSTPYCPFHSREYAWIYEVVIIMSGYYEEK